MAILGRINLSVRWDTRGASAGGFFIRPRNHDRSGHPFAGANQAGGCHAASGHRPTAPACCSDHTSRRRQSHGRRDSRDQTHGWAARYASCRAATMVETYPAIRQEFGHGPVHR